MKILLRKEVEAFYLDLDVAVRYDDEDMPFDAPMRQGSDWKVRVNLNTHTIENWPQGKTLEFYMKVCDEGVYNLLDANCHVIVSRSGYVPNKLLPGEYGDYLDLKIDEMGRITNWLGDADLSDFEQNND